MGATAHHSMGSADNRLGEGEAAGGGEICR